MKKYLTFILIPAVCFYAGCTSQNTSAVKNSAVSTSSNKPQPQQTDEKVPQSSRIVRIGHYQCICKQGDFGANLKTVIHGLELAKEANLDILSFPESLLTGYFDTKELAMQNSFSVDSPQMKKVLDETSHFDIMFIVGFTERDGSKLYDSVAVIEKGKLIGTYHKAFPTHSLATPGREFPVFEKKGLKFGVIICADGGYIEPSRILAIKGAKVIFAPHYNFVDDPVMHFQRVKNDHIARAVENGIYFVRANNVVKGTKVEGLDYVGEGYGDSYIVSPIGQIVAGAGLYEETLMIYSLDLDKPCGDKGVRNSLRSANALFDILKSNLRPSK